MVKYNIIQRIFHWLMAFVIISLIGAGFYMTNLGQSDPSKYEIYSMHKTIGTLALVLVTIRVLVRIFSKIPDLPREITSFEKLLAKLGHFALYFFMISMPLAGVIMSLYSGRSINFFGIEIKDLVEVNHDIAKIAHKFHMTIPIYFAGLIMLHSFAVIYHYVKQKINLLQRIW